MTNHANFVAEFVAHRLHGEQPPGDLRLLLQHRDELAQRAGVVLDSGADWAPWLDTSYLSEKDWADPGIRANVRAINEVCQFIDFVIEDEERNYIGYWRGPSRIALAQAPLVCFDNEGQFDLCYTSNLAGAMLVNGSRFDEFRAWLESIGIESLPADWDDLVDIVAPQPSPQALHQSLYQKYVAEENSLG